MLLKVFINLVLALCFSSGTKILLWVLMACGQIIDSEGWQMPWICHGFVNLPTTNIASSNRRPANAILCHPTSNPGRLPKSLLTESHHVEWCIFKSGLRISWPLRRLSIQVSIMLLVLGLWQHCQFCPKLKSWLLFKHTFDALQWEQRTHCNENRELLIFCRGSNNLMNV